jgi:hypothetical protein
MKALDKYLLHYCEAEVAELEGLTGHYQQGLVIPVYREPADTLQRFCEFAEQQSATLLILVVNRPDTDTDTSWAAPYFEHPGPEPWQSAKGQLRLQALTNNSGLLLVDRCHKGPPIPRTEGVGLARKIGCDLLCKLIHDGRVKSPWLCNSDADALLPDNYFQALQGQSAAAVLYPYRHIGNNCQQTLFSTRLYEFSLHYYVEGLRWAGSPYAYHSLGSIIAIDYHHYAQVRGFPKRAGAEDFYLLNKLLKTGDIVSLKQPVISLLARQSERVPFGTGPAVKTLSEQADPLAMSLYHPHSFVLLKSFHDLLYACCQQAAPTDYRELIASLCAPGQADAIAALAEQLNLAGALSHAYQQGKSAGQRRQQLAHWFDAFRTLKAIHFWRDHSLSTISFQCWWQQRQQWPWQNDRLLELAQGILSE